MSYGVNGILKNKTKKYIFEMKSSNLLEVDGAKYPCCAKSGFFFFNVKHPLNYKNLSCLAASGSQRTYGQSDFLRG